MYLTIWFERQLKEHMDYEFTLNLKILDTFLSQSQYTIKSQIGKTKHR